MFLYAFLSYSKTCKEKYLNYRLNTAEPLSLLNDLEISLKLTRLESKCQMSKCQKNVKCQNVKKMTNVVYSGHALSYTKLVHRHATQTEGNKYFK